MMINREEVDNGLKMMGKKELRKLIDLFVEKYGDEAATMILEATAERRKPIDAATSSSSMAASTSSATTEKKPKKEFDMQRYRQRHIAMQIQYEGEHYFGFTSQTGGCEETVEKHLFDALLKLKLITDKQSCNYSRCGRTDRGVSALGQIVALSVRSAIPLALDSTLIPAHPCDTVVMETSTNTTDAVDVNSSTTAVDVKEDTAPEQSTLQTVLTQNNTAGSRKRKASSQNSSQNVAGITTTTITTKTVKEMDYCTMLNRCLPDHIRVLGWCEVTPEFSSRFSCGYRTYRYFFIKKDLDVDLMNQAGYILYLTDSQSDFTPIFATSQLDPIRTYTKLTTLTLTLAITLTVNLSLTLITTDP